MHTMIIGIAGGTGSGKTTLTDHLAAHFGPAISVVHHDNYYKRQDVPFEVRCQQNYDHPDAFDTDLMVQQLKELKAGRTIRCPVYSYADYNRTDETVLIRPAPVIIVEGILIFHDPRLRQLMDIRIFVETDADVRILRRALRDVEERGRSMQSIVQQYLTTVKPMHEQFVEPRENMPTLWCWRAGTTWWPWISLCSALPATLRKIRRRMQHERRQAPSVLLGRAVHRFGSVFPAALGHRCAPYRDVFPGGGAGCPGVDAPAPPKAQNAAHRQGPHPVAQPAGAFRRGPTVRGRDPGADGSSGGGPARGRRALHGAGAGV